jgi:hypothetical protein
LITCHDRTLDIQRGRAGATDATTIAATSWGPYQTGATTITRNIVVDVAVPYLKHRIVTVDSTTRTAIATVAELGVCYVPTLASGIVADDGPLYRHCR